jgi:hypothetical protein
MKFYQSIKEYFDTYKHFYLDNFEACINVICDPFKYYTRGNFQIFLPIFKKVFLIHTIKFKTVLEII